MKPCVFSCLTRVELYRQFCSFASSSAEEHIITSPLGTDKEIPETGFAVTLFDGLKNHQPSATALVSRVVCCLPLL